MYGWVEEGPLARGPLGSRQISMFFSSHLAGLVLSGFPLSRPSSVLLAVSTFVVCF